MSDSKNPKQDIGAPVPDVTLPLLAGELRPLQSFLDGKRGAVVVFWSGVCSHCVRYDAYLNGFQERYPEIALVAIAARHGETVEQLKAAASERKLRFPLLHDRDGAVARSFYAQQTPRVYLLDPNRVLLYRGAIDNFKYPDDPEFQAYLGPAVEAFLGGKPVARQETASFGCAIQSVYYILPKPL
jgi:peroxiredoxin